MQFSEYLEQSKSVIPVIAINDLEQAVPMAQALSAAGITILEITLRTPNALAAIKLIKQQLPELKVGAGTVINQQQLLSVADAGADFIIAPGITDSLLSAAKEWGGVFMPGVATAGEIMQALEAGFTQLKCFPASAVGGIDLLKAWAGPFSQVSFCPTGGISTDNYQQYLALPNVMCVGGSWLVTEQDLVNKDFAAIKQKALAV